MPSCYICKRSRNAKSISANITFHRFPSDKIMLQKWHDFITRNNLNLQNINKSRVICSSHFSPESFIIRKNSKVLLRHAIPNIMISRVKGAKVDYCEVRKKIPVPKLAIHDNHNSSNFQMKRILDKVSDTCSEAPKDILPAVVDLDPTVVNTSSDTVKVHDRSKHPENILSLVDSDKILYQWSTSLDTFNKHIPIIKEMSDDISCEVESLNESKSTVTNWFNWSISKTKMKSNRSFFVASSPSDDDTPQCSYLKYGIRRLLDEINIKNSRLKILQQTVRKKSKKITSISKMLSSLKDKNTNTRNCINNHTSSSSSDSIKAKDLKSNSSDSVIDVTLIVAEELQNNRVLKGITNDHDYYICKPKKGCNRLRSTKEVTSTLTLEDLLFTN